MLLNSLTPSVVESVTITLIEFVIVYILHQRILITLIFT